MKNIQLKQVFGVDFYGSVENIGLSLIFRWL